MRTPLKYRGIHESYDETEHQATLKSFNKVVDASDIFANLNPTDGPFGLVANKILASNDSTDTSRKARKKLLQILPTGLVNLKTDPPEEWFS